LTLTFGNALLAFGFIYGYFN